MSDFAGMEDLLQDFLQEAHDLLSDVDNKLVDLEKTPDDRGLLNDIFRGFHTVKGGAGFLNAAELVTLCHLTENLFDRLRNGELELTPELMDVIMAATKGVRDMFGELGQMVQPQPAEAHVIAALQGALRGELPGVQAVPPARVGKRLMNMKRAGQQFGPGVGLKTHPHGRFSFTGFQNGAGAGQKPASAKKARTASKLPGGRLPWQKPGLPPPRPPNRPLRAAQRGRRSVPAGAASA